MSQRSQFTFALTWLALGTAATALAPTQALVWVTCFVLGVGFAPAFTAIHGELARVAKPEQSTEAFTWMATNLLVGIGVGWAIAGQLVEGMGWRGAMLAGAACMAAVAGLALHRKHASLEALA
jgi:MFS family permease